MIGGLIGLFGGPLGIATGAAVGFFVGLALDVGDSHVTAQFVTDVSRALTRRRTAIVARISEESTHAVDTRMRAFSGKVFRRAMTDVDDAAYERDAAAVDGDIAQTGCTNTRNSDRASG